MAQRGGRAGRDSTRARKSPRDKPCAETEALPPADPAVLQLFQQRALLLLACPPLPDNNPRNWTPVTALCRRLQISKPWLKQFGFRRPVEFVDTIPGLERIRTRVRYHPAGPASVPDPGPSPAPPQPLPRAVSDLSDNVSGDDDLAAALHSKATADVAEKMAWWNAQTAQLRAMISDAASADGEDGEDLESVAPSVGGTELEDNTTVTPPLSIQRGVDVLRMVQPDRSVMDDGALAALLTRHSGNISNALVELYEMRLRRGVASCSTTATTSTPATTTTSTAAATSSTTTATS